MPQSTLVGVLNALPAGTGSPFDYELAGAELRLNVGQVIDAANAFTAGQSVIVQGDMTTTVTYETIRQPLLNVSSIVAATVGLPSSMSSSAIFEGKYIHNFAAPIDDQYLLYALQSYIVVLDVSRVSVTGLVGQSVKVTGTFETKAIGGQNALILAVSGITQGTNAN